MCKKHLSEKYIRINRIRATLLLSLWWFICGGIAAFSLITASILAFISVAVYIFVIFYYLQAAYNAYTYTLGGEHIIIKKGVFFSKRINVFRSRVQYAQLIQTPLQKLFRTCTIAYQVAGAVVYLSEIDIKFADGAMFNEKTKA